MADSEFPAPQSGFVLTHFLVVSDQDRSREFYRSVFGASVVLERDPVILKLANSWLILNVGGGPTDDKPTVTLAPPADPDRASAFLNIRVADIAAAYAEWSAKGAEFLTEPKDHGREIRAYMRSSSRPPVGVRPMPGADPAIPAAASQRRQNAMSRIAKHHWRRTRTVTKWLVRTTPDRRLGAVDDYVYGAGCGAQIIHSG
jgi:catechol 2,3-dioxygenase-like lactoylglutathione lyase family enzyme